MYMEGYFLVCPEVRKVEGPYSRGSCVYEEMVVVAPPDYPQLADGLQIGAIYDEVSRPDGISSGVLHGISSREKYYEWCEILVSLVTNGKKLKELTCPFF